MCVHVCVCKCACVGTHVGEVRERPHKQRPHPPSRPVHSGCVDRDGGASSHPSQQGRHTKPLRQRTARPTTCTSGPTRRHGHRWSSHRLCASPTASCVCVYVCVCARVYVHVHTYVRVRACGPVGLDVRMHVWIRELGERGGE